MDRGQPATDGADALAIALFRRWSGLDRSARERELSRLRQDFPEAYRLFEAMQEAQGKAHALDRPLPTHLLDDPAPGDATQGRLQPGERLGPWCIDGLLAEGGMGTVYQAHRDDGQYSQRVAIKCIRLDVSSPRLLRKFLEERHLLARLEHPNIVPLLDGGVDANGLPWFAMRYVDGQPIDQWCDQRRPPLQARVRLLLQACDALAYAHARGVIHQDLKPSNLLVTGSGQVQLLDFGLSNAITDGQGERPLAISIGYAAPELVQGSGVPGVATDIYSLGQLLSRLACSLTPLDAMFPGTQAAAHAGLSAMARHLPDQVAHERGLSNAAALAKALAGDLDAIHARCTHADPACRYDDVAALAADLHAWIARRPVAARGTGMAYRARAFLRRHRLPVALLGMLVAAIGSGATVAAWLHHRAAASEQAIHEVTRLFQTVIGTTTLSGLGDTPHSSLDFLQATEAQVRALDLSAQPAVLAQALNALARGYALAGDYPHAEGLVNEATRLQGQDAVSIADTHATLAALLNIRAQHDDARQLAGLALQSLPRTDAARPVRLRLMTEVARGQWESAQRDQALRTLGGALALAREDLQADPTPYIELLVTRGTWSQRLFLTEAAMRDLDEALALADPAYPLLADAARQAKVRVLLLEDEVETASRLAGEVLANRRQRFGEEHPETGMAWTTLATTQCVAGDLQACLQSAQQARDVLARTLGTQHPHYAAALRQLAVVMMRQGSVQYEQGLPLARQAQAITRAVYPPGHELRVGMDAWLGNRLVSAPPGPERQARTSEGITLLLQALDEANRANLPMIHDRLTLAGALLVRGESGDFEAATRQIAQVRLEGWRFGPDHPARIAIEFASARQAYLSGDAAAADAAMQALVPRIQAQPPRNNLKVTLCNAVRLRAAIASRRGDAHGARMFLQQLVDGAAGKGGMRVHPMCGENAQEALRSLQETGRYALPLERSVSTRRATPSG